MTEHQKRLDEIYAKWPDADYYECDDSCERLQYSEVLEAIEEILSGIEPHEGDGSFEECIRSDVGESLTVYCWKRDTIDTQDLAERAQDTIAEAYSEDYGDPDAGGDLPPTLAAKLAAKLTLAVQEAFEGETSWQCTQTHEFEIPIDDLILVARAEWPEWFEENPSASA